MARASDADKFIQILVPHPESDVEVTCRRTRYETDEDGLSARDDKRFFCHRAVLKKHCTFSGNNRGDPPEKRRRTRLDLDADEDVVFEILRFVYCGTMYSSPFFRSKAFIELVAIADVLGIDASNEHVQSDMGQLSSNTSFLRDPALTTSLKKLPKVEISEIITGCRGSSYIMRTNLATLLVELRWHDLSKEDISGLGLDVDLRVVTLPGTLFAQWTGSCVHIDCTCDEGSAAAGCSAWDHCQACKRVGGACGHCHVARAWCPWWRMFADTDDGA